MAGLIELVLPRCIVEATQPGSGQLWYDRGRGIGKGEDRGNGIRLDLSLVLLWRHLDGVLALEVGGSCRDVVKNKQRGFAIRKMCALADPR